MSLKELEVQVLLAQASLLSGAAANAARITASLIGVGNLKSDQLTYFTNKELSMSAKAQKCIARAASVAGMELGVELVEEEW